MARQNKNKTATNLLDVNTEKREIRTAVGYGRVSSEESGLSGLSLSVQESEIRDYCKENGIKLLGYFEDPGVSAGLPVHRRPALVDCLEMIEKEKPDLLLIFRLDRLWRKVEQFYEVKKILDKNKTEFFCVDEPEYDTRTTNGRLFLNVRLSIAEAERDFTSDRIKAIFRSRMRKGIAPGGKKTFGYDYVRDEHGDFRMVINQDEAKIVRELFDHYLQCGSIEECTRWLNEEHGIIRGHKSMRYFILQNEHYIGRRVMWEQGASRKDKSKIIEVIENFCDPIIDMQTWERAQNLLEKHTKEPATKNRYIFSGLLRCSYCGRNLVGNPTQSVRGNYHYKALTYRCNTPRKESTKHLCDVKKYVREVEVEEYVKKNFVKLMEAHIFKAEESKPDYQGQEKRIAQKLAKARKKIGRINELYFEDAIDREEYDRRKKEVEDEIKKLEKEREDLGPIDIASMRESLAELKNFEEIYDSLTSQQKNVFYKQFIDYIEVDVEKRTFDIHFQ